MPGLTHSSTLVFEYNLTLDWSAVANIKRKKSSSEKYKTHQNSKAQFTHKILAHASASQKTPRKQKKHHQK